MSSTRLRSTGALLAASVALAAVVAPSLVLGADSADGGAGSRADLDLVAVSVAVAAPYAGWLHTTLRRVRSKGGQEADLWLSAVHGLVVLLVAASALPAAVLHVTAVAPERGVDAEWPLLLAWAVVMGVAVVLAEVVRRLSLRWLRRS